MCHSREGERYELKRETGDYRERERGREQLHCIFGSIQLSKMQLAIEKWKRERRVGREREMRGKKADESEAPYRQQRISFECSQRWWKKGQSDNTLEASLFLSIHCGSAQYLDKHTAWSGAQFGKCNSFFLIEKDSVQLFAKLNSHPGGLGVWEAEREGEGWWVEWGEAAYRWQQIKSPNECANVEVTYVSQSVSQAGSDQVRLLLPLSVCVYLCLCQAQLLPPGTKQQSIIQRAAWNPALTPLHTLLPLLQALLLNL